MCNTVEHREIKGQPGFLVGSDGVVWTYWRRDSRGYIRRDYSGGDWTEVVPHLHNHGYVYVYLFNAKILVHRIVLEAFVGPCPLGMQARHLDGVKTHNWLSNLEWGTQSDNEIDKILHGTSVRGSGNAMSKLTEDDIINIREFAAQGMTRRELVNMYGVTTIGRILDGKVWTHV